MNGSVVDLFILLWIFAGSNVIKLLFLKILLINNLQIERHTFFSGFQATWQNGNERHGKLRFNH